MFFSEVGGATLDSHHGFVVEYGKDRDVDLGKCHFPPFLVMSVLIQFGIALCLFLLLQAVCVMA